MANEDELDVICRLCLSKKNLVSLFSGKNRIMRDYIRKLVHHTVGIRIEEDDPFSKRVCINCCIDAFNCYNFRMLSLKNEDNLKHCSSYKTCPKQKEKKVKVLPLEEIKLPNYEELFQIISEWLITKQKNIRNTDKIRESVDSENAVQTDVTYRDFHMQTENSVTEAFTQTLKLNSTQGKSTQTDFNEIVKEKTQTKETYSQTNKLHHKNKNVQTDLYKNKINSVPNNTLQNGIMENADSDMICDKSNLNLYEVKVAKTKKEKCMKNKKSPESYQEYCRKVEIGVQEKMVQCDLTSHMNSNENHSKSFEIKATQTNIVRRLKTLRNSLNHAEKDYTEAVENQLIQCSLLEECTKCNKSQHTEEKMSQTDSTDIQHKTIQCELIQFNASYTNPPLISPVYSEYSREVDSKLNIKLCLNVDKMSPTFLEEVKYEKVSLDTCLNIRTSDPCDSEDLLSPTNLLKVNEKSDLVKTCKLCDKIFYSEKENALHRKLHMQCNLCKKKFRSYRQTRIHQSQCNIRQLTDTAPYIELVRIDKVKDLTSRYPKAFRELELLKKRGITVGN